MHPSDFEPRRPRMRLLPGRRRNLWVNLAPSLAVLLVIAGIIAFSPELRGRFFGYDDAAKQARKLRDIERLIGDHFYRHDWDREAGLTAAMEALVESVGDRYTEYLTREELEEFNQHASGHFAGLGVLLTVDGEGVPVITTPYPDTPAWNAGIRPGDRLIRIDGRDPRGHDFTTVVVDQWLKGKAGSVVTLTIEDREGNVRENVQVTRGDVKVPSVTGAQMLEGEAATAAGAGYMRIEQFQRETASDFLAEVNKLERQGLQNLIVDIRYNRGGLLNEVCELAGFFLARDRLVVRTDGTFEREYRATGDHAGELADLGLVILVNGSSASASEILSGALQDYKRALIVGEPTYGKGLVQNVYSLNDEETALKITIARYFTPSGRVIQRDDSTAWCPRCGTRYRATPSRLFCERDGTRLEHDPRAWPGGILPDVHIDVDGDRFFTLRRQLGELGIHDDRPPLPDSPPPDPFRDDPQFDAALRVVCGMAVPQPADTHQH